MLQVKKTACPLRYTFFEALNYRCNLLLQQIHINSESHTDNTDAGDDDDTDNNKDAINLTIAFLF